MKYHPVWSAAVTIMICCTVSALGQEGTSGTNVTGAANAPAQGSTVSQSASMGVSPGVADIIKMADAGVSPEVLKAYVESSAAMKRPTGADIIALKEHKVSDGITTLLLKRGTEAENSATEARNHALAQLVSSRRIGSGGLDPESYSYFQYYYLQPRAMASAYERLAPYYPGFGYGYNRPFLGRPFHPSFGFAR